MVIDYYVTSISNIILENILSSYCKGAVVHQLVLILQHRPILLLLNEGKMGVEQKKSSKNFKGNGVKKLESTAKSIK